MKHNAASFFEGFPPFFFALTSVAETQSGLCIYRSWVGWFGLTSIVLPLVKAYKGSTTDRPLGSANR